MGKIRNFKHTRARAQDTHTRARARTLTQSYLMFSNLDEGVITDPNLKSLFSMETMERSLVANDPRGSRCAGRDDNK